MDDAAVTNTCRAFGSGTIAVREQPAAHRRTNLRRVDEERLRAVDPLTVLGVVKPEGEWLRFAARRIAQASDVVEYPRLGSVCLVSRRIHRLTDQHAAMAAGAPVHDDLWWTGWRRTAPQREQCGSQSQLPTANYQPPTVHQPPSDPLGSWKLAVG